MKHVEELIERYWLKSTPLSDDEIAELKSHLIECDHCMDLMCSYEYAGKVIEEVITEGMAEGPETTEPEETASVDIEPLVEEFVSNWRSGERYQKLSWDVVKEKLSSTSFEVIEIYYPEVCYPDMSVFQKDAERIPDIGDKIGILFGSDISGPAEMENDFMSINSMIEISDEYLSLKNLVSSVPLVMRIEKEGETVFTLAPSEGEIDRVPVSELTGSSITIFIAAGSPGDKRKSA